MVEASVLLGVEMIDKKVKQDDIAVVIDVIRACTTILSALREGAESVIPVSSIREAQKIKKNESRILLSGERRGVKIRGFDLDNSPSEVKSADIKDRKLVLTTTHGTLLLTAAMEKTENVLVGAMVNRMACSKLALELANKFESDIQILIPHSQVGICIEDLYAAGLIVKGLSSYSVDLQGDLTAIAALIGDKDLDEMKKIIMQATFARIVKSIGHIDDVKYCLKLDEVNMVPASFGNELKAQWVKD